MNKTAKIALWVIALLSIVSIFAIPASINATKKTMTSCICMQQCISDYKEYGTANIFTIYSHKTISLESRSCENVNVMYVNNCCINNQN